MSALLLLHAVLGLGTVAAGAHLGRRALWVTLVPMAVTLAWIGSALPSLLDGEVREAHAGWVPAMGLGIDLRLDAFGALMTLLVSGIGVLVVLYARWYFPATKEHLGRLAGLLTLFAGAMLGVVWADNLLVLYTCWELTSLTSYLLIGNDHRDPRARAAALHALLVTVTGGLAMLGGFVVLGQAAGTYRLSEILERAPSGSNVTIALLLVLVGVGTKSAQYPFHGWLPGAMAAPTPVSAYLHSATMVKAGIYLLARFAPVYALTGFWRPLVTTVGLVTMILGGLRALRQHDLKLLLAFGTVSQLGFLAVLFGLGTTETVEAGCALLLAHGAFKAALFMVVGILDHQTGTRDLRELPALGAGWPVTKLVMVVSAASMAGLPLVAGFIAKEAAYASVADSGLGARAWILAGLVAGSALTVAYSARFVWGVLRPAGAVSEEGAAPAAEVRETPPPALPFVLPGLVLAALTLVGGLVPRLLDRLVGAADAALVGVDPHTHLALWHGLNLPLLLSAVTIAIGASLFLLRAPLAKVLRTGEVVPSGGDVYLWVLRGLNRVATVVTGVVQNGSLPIYAAVILLFAALAPVVTLFLGDGWTGWPELVDHPGHLPVAALILFSAIAAATNRRRVSAVLFLGLTGYSMAALYVLQGAPDLALTTVAIETLSTVLFILVLRHLPVRFERRSTPQRRIMRLVAAGAVGLSVFVLALAAGGSRTAEPVSQEMVERSYPDGHGRNVVNVILVDFRGFDTFGEITVLAAASIGMVALARAGRRPRRLQVEEPAG